MEKRETEIKRRREDRGGQKEGIQRYDEKKGDKELKRRRKTRWRGGETER